MSLRRESHEDLPGATVVQVGGLVVTLAILSIAAAYLLVKIALKVA